MRKNFFAFFGLSILLSLQTAFAQQRISGFVKDKSSGERLINAHVHEKGADMGVVTNNNGYFNLLTTSNALVEVSYIGYKTAEIALLHSKDTIVTIQLEPSAELEEVVIRANTLPQPFVSTFDSKQLNAIPALGGKPDVIKAIQLLPGILPQNEGSSRLIVRGGTPGENLFLIDNIPLIYVNHLGGFTSVFNPDIINKVDVYKGGFPARYGGKLSSVVDISQKEGNITQQNGSFSIGVTDASLTLEGPTKIRNSSYIVTARKTMVDALQAMASGFSNANSFVLAYGFHDLNAKFSWKPNTANSLHINLYQGDDYINYWTKKKHFHPGEKGMLNNTWGNWLLSTRWHRIVSSNLYGITSLSYSRYRLKEKRKFTFGPGAETLESGNLSAVQDLSLRSDWKYQPVRNWSVDFGLQSSLYTHKPNESYRSGDNFYSAAEKIFSSETALYADNSISFLGRSELNAGGRLVSYLTENYSNVVFEPRAQLKIGITPTQSLNASYMKVNQFAHLLFTQGNINNVDVWVPAGEDVAPAFSSQYSAGWNGSFFRNKLQLSAEAYYKELNGLSTYREGYANLIGDGEWRSKLISNGSGTSRGIEFSASKAEGNWTGFINYTLSNTEYQFPEINEGRPYVFEYDRPHSAAISARRKLSEKWSVNLTWIYQTGLPYTPAVGRMLVPVTDDNNEEFESDHYEALIYGGRNSERMRDYHRLDVSFTKRTQSKKWKLPVEWTFSIYNAYNRFNPYYYYYNNNSGGLIEEAEWGLDLGKLSLYQVSFFPIIPSISYKVYFHKGFMDGAEKKSFKERMRRLLYHE